MQIMPRTAEFLGFDDVATPEANIRCGIRYMKWLEQLSTQSAPRERWVGMLASYNSGPGHYAEMVRRTKERYGTDDWNHVAKTYRRRFRHAPGQRLPETLIYVRRNIDTLQRLHERLFAAADMRTSDLSTAVRIPPPGAADTVLD